MTLYRLFAPAALALALAACGGNGGDAEEAGGGAEIAGAPDEAAKSDRAERPVAARMPTYPDGTFVQAPDCATLPAPAATICLRPVLSAASGEPELSIEITRIDVDGDGTRDMLLRRRSVNDCGTRGCATYVLFARGSQFVPADPPINAEGPVEPCRNDGAPGVRFPQAGGDAACIAVTPAAAVAT